MLCTGALSKDEFRAPHGELLVGVLVVQDFLFGGGLALLSIQGGGEAGEGGDRDHVSGSFVCAALIVTGVGVKVLGQLGRSLECRRAERWRLPRQFMSWIRQRLLGPLALTNEVMVLGLIAVMTCGRTATEALGLSSELGCLLAGLLVGHSPACIFPPPGSKRSSTKAGDRDELVGMELGALTVAERAPLLGSSNSSAANDDDDAFCDGHTGGGGGGGGWPDLSSNSDSNASSSSSSVKSQEISPRSRGASGGAGDGHGHGGGPSSRSVVAVGPVRDLLVALFFVSCGQHLSPGFMADLLGLLVSLAAAAMLLKLGVVTLSLKVVAPNVGRQLSPSTIGLVAAGLAQISEVSFFIASRAKRQGLIGRDTHFVLLATTSLSLAFAPILWGVATGCHVLSSDASTAARQLPAQGSKPPAHNGCPPALAAYR